MVIGEEKGLLTREMCEQAVEMVRPAAEAILETEGMTWSVKHGYGEIKGPGVEAFPFHFGNIDQKWESDKWGEERNFFTIAHKKRKLAAREGRKTTAVVRTSEIVNTRPQVLERGEDLYSGGVSFGEISIGFSGALGWVDEAIAEMVLIALQMILHVTVEAKLKAHDSQV